MKVEVWYAVDEDGTQCLYTEKPKRYEDNINGWVNSDWGDKDELAENFNYAQISEEDRIKLNIPIISWGDEPIKIELDIQAMVINQ